MRGELAVSVGEEVGLGERIRAEFFVGVRGIVGVVVEVGWNVRINVGGGGSVGRLRVGGGEEDAGAVDPGVAFGISVGEAS